MAQRPDILKARFCIYCQKYFDEPKGLQRHLRRYHKGTYPANAVAEALRRGKK